MAAAEIKIDQSMVAEMVKKAIIEQLGTEQRDLLISQALDFLVAPSQIKPDRYSDRTVDGPSFLETAFKDAVLASARTLVQTIVAESPEVVATIRSKVGEAFTNMEGYDITRIVGEALANSLSVKHS